MTDEQIMDFIHKQVSEDIDREIMRVLGVENYRPARVMSGDIISDLDNMIYKNSKLIVCHPKTKELLESAELPPFTVIMPDARLEENKVYVITDKNLKINILRGMMEK